MRHNHVLTKPVKVSDMSFDDIFGDMSYEWEEKARKLQVRRMRAMKRAMKGMPSAKH